MTRTRLGVLVALVTAVATLAAVAVAWTGAKWFTDGLGRDPLWQDCSIDRTLSGRQGFCVTVSRYPGTPVHSERTYLEIAAVHGGSPLPVHFRSAYPFSPRDAGRALEVDWSRPDQAVTVTDPDTGAAITYTYEQYGGGR